MTGTENRPGKKARSLSRKRIQEKRECWWWGYIKILSDPSGSASSLPSFSSPCLSMALTPPCLCGPVSLHLSFLLWVSLLPPSTSPWYSLGSLPLLLPGISMGPSSPGGELVPPSQVVHPLTKETNESSRSNPAYGVAVRRPCHQRHQMSPDFCSVSSETLLSLYLPLA